MMAMRAIAVLLVLGSLRLDSTIPCAGYWKYGEARVQIDSSREDAGDDNADAKDGGGNGSGGDVIFLRRL